ncbi:MAG: LLM class flavin-dependent oxidoreductase [Alphaproteobacteria bacterium]|nr:LLM class flavin-dependent oxidoreductase [Alphaproteobacteria bacterium]
MSARQDICFDFAVAPVGAPGTPDAGLYDEVVADCRRGQALGYGAAWMLEHHFSDYFPTPSPFVFMSHVAALCPGLGLGTCVMVLPWHNPLRFAEEVAMLSLLSSGDLHLGLGRGTAKLEYDAFGIDMEEARERFREGLEVVQHALSGEPFRFAGEFFRMDREVTIRPHPNRERIHFYGAIGSPPSAAMMAEYGLPPLSLSNFPLHMQQKILESWSARTGELGGDEAVTKPIVIHAVIADSDDEARALVRRYLPPFYALQARHYEADADHWRTIKGYEQFSKFFANLKRLADPEQIDPWTELQLVGTAETAAARLERYIELGFNRFVIHAATVGIPRPVRHQMLSRFAAEVAPRFSAAFAAKSAA